MGFSRQECWSGLPFPPPEDLPDIEPPSPVSPVLQADFLPTQPLGEPRDKFIGEGNGNALQYSCLVNPRDRGAWWAAAHGVAQSRIRLKQLSSSSNRGEIRMNSRFCPSLIMGETRVSFPFSCQHGTVIAAAQNVKAAGSRHQQ